MDSNIKKGIGRGRWYNLQQNTEQKLAFTAVLFIIFLGFFCVSFKYIKNETSVLQKMNISYSNYIKSENDQRCKVVLPDSSIVWLNSGTTLSYCNNFSGNGTVMIERNAFQITQNENSPFISQNIDLEISVLKTKFNVNGYPGNSRKSVVLESGILKSKNYYKHVSCYSPLKYTILENLKSETISKIIT